MFVLTKYNTLLSKFRIEFWLLILRISTWTVVNLTLIDLPGLTKVAVGKSPTINIGNF